MSPSGRDSWSGRLPAPGPGLGDGPFATLEGALRAARKVLPRRGVTLFLRAGVYRRTKTLVLGPGNSGRAGAPLVIRSFPGERAVLSGARDVSAAFHPLRDSWALHVLRPGLRGKVLEADLRALGISDLGEVAKRGSPGLELFFRGKRMPRARYPDHGWLKIAGVPQYKNRKPFWKGCLRERRYGGVPAGRHFGEIQYSGKRPESWSKENEIYMHGYWTWDWNDSYERLAAVDPQRKILVLRPPYHRYGYTKGQRYAFLNILEELDRPGEWVLHRKKGKLFFLPPGPIQEGEAQVSLVAGPLIEMKGCRNVKLLGLVFTGGRGDGVVVTGGGENLVAGCEFTLLGGGGVTIEKSPGSGVRGCSIHDVGLGGVRVSGGDRTSLTPSRNFVVNNHIHHYSQVVRTYQWAVDFRGVGVRVAHNLVHDAPQEAFHLAGNDHLVEYNEIHHIVKETGDSGALHTGRDYTWRGNVIRYNYIHHLEGPGLHGAIGVYLDDFASGFQVYGNVFYKAGRAVEIGGGRDNLVENNLFVQCAPSIHLDARGLGWAMNYFDGRVTTLQNRLKAVPYDRPPYSIRYPSLKTLYRDDPAVPKHNVITRNVSFGGRWMDVYDFWAFPFQVVTVKNNLIADSLVLRRRKKGLPGPDPYYLDIDKKEGYEALGPDDPEVRILFAGNLFFEGNPGILDFRPFRLSPSSPAWKLGFRPIPFSKIGLQAGPFRNLLPGKR